MSDFVLVVSVILHTTFQPVSFTAVVRCWLALRRTLPDMALSHVAALPSGVLRWRCFAFELWSPDDESDSLTVVPDLGICPKILGNGPRHWDLGKWEDDLGILAQAAPTVILH